MALLGVFLSMWIAVVIPVWLSLYYVIPYLVTYRQLNRIPGPWSAKFSNVWIGLGARRGQKYAVVDSAHRKYGKVVRIGFNHVSIADERALNVVYGHGNGFLKEYVRPTHRMESSFFFNNKTVITTKHSWLVRQACLMCATAQSIHASERSYHMLSLPSQSLHLSRSW